MISNNRYLEKVGRNTTYFTLSLIFNAWYGSVYQAILVDVWLFLMLYTFFTSIFYIFVAPYSERRETYEKAVVYIAEIQEITPLAWIVGFFVSSLLKRWISICFAIPSLCSVAIIVQTFVPTKVRLTKRKSQPVDKEMRRCLLRYLNLAWALQLAPLSVQMQKRFPAFELRKGGPCGSVRERLEQFNKDEVVMRTFGKLVSEQEIQVLEQFATLAGNRGLCNSIPYWVPLLWSVKLIDAGLKSGVISSSAERELQKTVLTIRKELQAMDVQVHHTIPLAYVQTVTLAVYIYFLAEIFTGNDATLERPKNFPNLYFPLRSIVKIMNYIGWYKVAINVLNPLGVDPQDFAISKLFTDNLEKSYVSAFAADDFMFPPILDVYLANKKIAIAEDTAAKMGHRLVNPSRDMAAYQVQHATAQYHHEMPMAVKVKEIKELKCPSMESVMPEIGFRKATKARVTDRISFKRWTVKMYDKEAEEAAEEENLMETVEKELECEAARSEDQIPEMDDFVIENSPQYNNADGQPYQGLSKLSPISKKIEYLHCVEEPFNTNTDHDSLLYIYDDDTIIDLFEMDKEDGKDIFDSKWYKKLFPKDDHEPLG